MNDPYILLGVIGSVASVVSLLIAAPTAKSRMVHVVYAVLLTVITGVSINRLAESSKREHELALRLQHLEAIEAQARKLLGSQPYVRTDDPGENRGFFLAGIAFLEKNKDDFPEVFEMAKKLGLNGIKITESASDSVGGGASDERKRLNDGAQTMRSLLLGIAGGTEGK